MLFIFAVLSSVVALVAAQGASSPLPKDAKDALKFINEANDETMIDQLGKAPTFGCDGVLNAQLKKYDCLTFVCLYRKQ
ncbi:unnamed protein product [Haemonchus placei]|uniref:Secreted protein n=2 Tax=Haemonchus TaxID=6288 RepID=A0A0N4WSV7_HAEPC|nr:unnamed protein product [Haemonchus placei]